MPAGRKIVIVGRDEEFVRDWEANLPLFVMAEKYRVSKPTILNHAQRLGLGSRENRRNAK